MDLERKVLIDILSAFDFSNDRLPKIIEKYFRENDISHVQRKK